MHFRGIKALESVDLSLRRGEILGLIGPNGAGKTTLVNAVSGFQRPTSGATYVAGQEITNWPPHRLARSGIVRTFQGLRPFRDLTVSQNVVAAAVAMGATWTEAYSRSARFLQMVGLDSYAEARADSLPYGAERRLGIARAVATMPRFILLDEPAAGLSEAESDQLVDLIRQLRDDLACGVLVIEHDMRVIMSLCERIQVLDFGNTIFIGSPGDVRKDPRVIAAYLGGDATKAPDSASD